MSGESVVLAVGTLRHNKEPFLVPTRSGFFLRRFTAPQPRARGHACVLTPETQTPIKLTSEVPFEREAGLCPPCKGSRTLAQMVYRENAATRKVVLETISAVGRKRKCQQNHASTALTAKADLKFRVQRSGMIGAIDLQRSWGGSRRSNSEAGGDGPQSRLPMSRSTPHPSQSNSIVARPNAPLHCDHCRDALSICACAGPQ
jgi:hypothetical protein